MWKYLFKGKQTHKAKKILRPRLPLRDLGELQRSRVKFQALIGVGVK